MAAQTRLLAGDPWPNITKFLERQGRGSAECAIAYIGAAAPGHLPLREGDLLVCNASDNALRGHATDIDALLLYADAAVEIRNARQLHAKIVVCDGVAWVGSANASRNSAVRLEEAVLRTSEPNAVKSALAYVRGLARSHTPMDRPALEALRSRVPSKPAPVLYPPIGPHVVAPPLGLPGASDKVHFIETTYETPTEEEELEAKRQTSVVKDRQRRARVRARLSSAWWSGRRVPRGEWVCWVHDGRVDRPWLVADYTKFGPQTWMWGFEPFASWPEMSCARLDRILAGQDPPVTLSDRLGITGRAVNDLAAVFHRTPPRDTE